MIGEIAAHLASSPARRRVVDEDVTRILGAPLPWSDLEDRIVLISGANGFLAAYMVETLLGMKAAFGFGPRKVVGLVRSLDNAHARFAHRRGREDLDFIVSPVEAEFKWAGPLDFIIHAASHASPKFYLTDPVGVMSANIEGTRNLLELARVRNSCLLYFSSSEVYGQALRVPTGEVDFGPLDPAAVRSCYGESKRAGETMCVSWGHQHGVQTRIVRPFHTYGPGVALDDGRVFADFVADVVAGRNIVVKSDGKARRAFCYIADATEGFFTVLLKGENGTAYNIGNDEGELSIHELAELLAGLFPERGVKVVMDPAQRSANYSASPVSRNAPAIERARALGWSPRTSVAEGFRRMIASYMV